jgi:tetratricopeptide (TPR) repeat protein
MKRYLFLFFSLMFLAGYAEAKGSKQADEIISLDQALTSAVAAIEKEVKPGMEIVIAKIDAPLPEISDFLTNKLTDSFKASGKLVILARGKALENVNSEQNFQLSGAVSDESAVGIGHELGAKAVITGTFDRYDKFSQLRLRAIDVKTSAVITVYSALIKNNDSVLMSVTMPLEKIKMTAVTKNVLENLNNGKDYYAAEKYDEAINEFNRALAANKNLMDGYFWRGRAYYNKDEYKRAAADFSAALKIYSGYADALYFRGNVYIDMEKYDDAIKDLSGALQIYPNDAKAYYDRGYAYSVKENYDWAIADFDSALRISPNDAAVFNERGVAYYNKGSNDQAIADFDAALKITPNDADTLYNRGLAYIKKGDFDRAIADFSSALKINPDDVETLTNRGNAYCDKGDYTRGIADYRAALKINPEDELAKNGLEIALKKQVR